MVPSSAESGNEELNVPSVLVFGHFICERANNVLHEAFSNRSGMSQWVHDDSLIVLDLFLESNLNIFGYRQQFKSKSLTR